MSTSNHHPSLLERGWNRFEVLIGSLVDPGASKASSSASNRVRTKERSNRSRGDEDLDVVALGIELTLRLVIAVSSGYLMLWMTRKLFGPVFGEQEGAVQQPASVVYRRLAGILAKRGQKATSLPSLTPYERQMAEEVVDPDDIENSFADIGGLDNTKREIYELAILPLVQPDLFQHGKLVQPCKGILLYGQPGTGKTMLAKALAKEAHAVFLPLHLSKILNKWVGESNKLIAATFSLARKLQPAIIFIDELDTFLKANNSETAYLDAIKAEFLTLWDGVTTSATSRVLVLGATNKPHTIDPAILRRMPRSFMVPLPDERGRLSILEILFDGESIDPLAKQFLPELAKLTKGYSGSDLKEMCKAAAMIRIQERTTEYSRRRVMGENPVSITDKQLTEDLRPISTRDLLSALQKVQRTGEAATKYGRDHRREAEGVQIDTNALAGLKSLLRMISNAGDEESESESDDMPTV